MPFFSCANRRQTGRPGDREGEYWLCTSSLLCAARIWNWVHHFLLRNSIWRLPRLFRPSLSPFLSYEFVEGQGVPPILEGQRKKQQKTASIHCCGVSLERYSLGPVFCSSPPDAVSSVLVRRLVEYQLVVLRMGFLASERTCTTSLRWNGELVTFPWFWKDEPLS